MKKSIWFTLLLLLRLTSNAQLDSSETKFLEPERLTLSVNFNPFFFAFEYAAPDIGIECRLAKRITLFGTYGQFLNIPRLSHQTPTAGLHSHAAIRYYPKYNHNVLSLGFSYQELHQPFHGTFPSRYGYYLKELQRSQYRKLFTFNYGSRAPITKRWMMEGYVGVGVEFSNNHFVGFNTDEKAIAVRDLIPEIKKAGGFDTVVGLGYIWSLRLVYPIL